MLCNVLVCALVAVVWFEVGGFARGIQSCHRDPSWILLAPSMCQHHASVKIVIAHCVCMRTIVNCWGGDDMLCRFIDGRWQLGR